MSGVVNLFCFDCCLNMATGNVSPSETSKVYLNDPLYLQSFVNSYVEVKTSSGSSFKGFVYTIDPVSESVILLRRKDDRISMDIIVGHSVSSISPISSTDGHSEPIPDEILFVTGETISEEEAESRRVKLKAWLCANHIPVVEDGNMLVLEDVVVIESPYGLRQCLVSNDMIMERVHNLMKEMPWVDSAQ